MMSNSSDHTLLTVSDGSDSTTKMKIEELVENKYTVRDCMDIARRSVSEKTSLSSLLDTNAERNVPKFDMSELLSGRMLGKGAFCDVHEISKISLNQVHVMESSMLSEQPRQVLQGHMDNDDATCTFVQDRYFMGQHYLRGHRNDCRYAVKTVQLRCKQNVQTYINAVTDLAIEARFLAVICHPNIIKMRAMAQTSPFSTTKPFFVVLDRLYDILTTRISKWKKQKPTGLVKLLDCSATKERMFLYQRIAILYDLATALKYLHDLKMPLKIILNMNSIVYRDIKPDNIGFDIRDDVKIFDFGLAKEFDPSKQDENGLYNMTPDTGSLRYMAPEVFLTKPYNQLVDVYSFATLMWQILALQTPYTGYTVSLIKAKVYEGGVRMKCDPKWSKPIRDIIERGWGGSIQHRPDMDEIVNVLRNELCACSPSQAPIRQLDDKRKSDKSFSALYP